MAVPIWIVDAFTDRPFRGNPAAVCILQQPATPDWMQAVAGEMNLAETAFLWPLADGYSLRWFTPTVEVALCGHATLASAHVLWSAGFVPPEQQARFQTASGLLTADRKGEWIDLDFPAEPAAPVAILPPELAASLHLPVHFLGKNRMDYLIVTDAESTVRALTPNMAVLQTLQARGTIVTAPASTPGFDFVSRFFAPGAGVAEDPVTGSAHCCLGPYWQHRLSKSDFMALQVSARSGVVRVGVRDNRIRLGGQAVLLFRGELLHDPVPLGS